MGRSIKPRVSYLDDCRYLVRLARSVELDTKRDDKWKRAVIAHATELMQLFNADACARADAAHWRMVKAKP